jgi:hypothetical protein
MDAQRDAQQGSGASMHHNEQYVVCSIYKACQVSLQVVPVISTLYAPRTQRGLYPPMEPSNASLSSLMEG